MKTFYYVPTIKKKTHQKTKKQTKQKQKKKTTNKQKQQQQKKKKKKKTLPTGNFPIQKYNFLYHASSVYRFRITGLAYTGSLLLQWR